MPDNGSDFYAFRLSNSQFLQVPRVTRYVGGTAVVTKKIAQTLENNIVSLEDIITFNGKLIGFLSDKKDGINNLYMVKYDTEIDPLGEPEIITSYPFTKGFNNKGSFNVITSPNSSHICVEYIIPGKRALFDRYGYKVIDSTFNIISEGEFEIPYNSKNASLEQRYLTNTGDYILGIAVYKNGNNSFWKDYTTLEKTTIIHVQGNELAEYELEIDGKRVFDVGIGSFDSLLVITGTYGDANSSGAQGVFLQRINLKSKTVESEDFDEFPREFMTQNLSVGEIDQIERRENRGRGGPQLSNYVIRGIHPLEDGSTVVVAEQFYIYQQSSTDSRGISQTVYHYYYNDVIAYKIDSSGVFNWIVKLPKEQHSINDYGYFSSISTMISDGKLLCFFNDNIRNYDEALQYEGFYRSISFPVRKKSYVLALGEIDLKTGEINRRVFNDYNQTNGFVVLKLSPIDYRKRQLLFVSLGRKERFGLMEF